MRTGDIKVVKGPMFAGKTTHLTAIHDIAPDHVIAVRPGHDTRWGQLSTHDGKSIDSITVNTSSDIMRILNDGKTIHRILFDECHFYAPELGMFSGDFISDIKFLSRQGIDVYIFGLNRDWRGDTFPIMDRIESIASEVMELNGTCSLCGAPSCRTQRIVPGTGSYDVGAEDLYRPVCLSCFEAGFEKESVAA